MIVTVGGGGGGGGTVIVFMPGDSYRWGLCYCVHAKSFASSLASSVAPFNWRLILTKCNVTH